ncbi:unnamed protein product [Candidula unifasciata]|uniref:EF-hand domain-containing protein n=1 Tax=Candidula unifasciata TaxID=100452 RepID=A0A8S3ZNJ5_9EUPU|nr:unnamed protein product [Candidula unifasciata]
MPLKANKKKEHPDRKKKSKHKHKTVKSGTVEYLVQEPTVQTLAVPSLRSPGEGLLNLLRSPAVCRKEVHGIRVTGRILEQLTPQEIRDLRFVFELFDLNSDGYLGPVEVWQALSTLGFTISRTEAAQEVQDISFGKRKEVSLSEFLEIVIDRQGDDRDSHCEIMKVFALFDLDSTGNVSAKTLQEVCRKAGVSLTRKELDEMVEEADINGDGCIDQAEFLRIMLQTSLF